MRERWSQMRRSPVWRAASDYFPIYVYRQSKKTRFNSSSNYLIGFHPVGRGRTHRLLLSDGL